jgi:hypothetical protein
MGTIKLEGFGGDLCMGGFKLSKAPVAREVFGAKVNLIGMHVGAHGQTGHGHGHGSEGA